MAKPDRNGLYNPRQHPDGLEAYQSNPPTTAKEAIERGYNTFIDEYGIEQKMRYKSRAKERNGAKYEIEVLANRDANRGSDQRRAATNQQSLTLKDYQDYARRNGYSQERAKELYEQNQARLKQVRQAVTASRGGTNYEHLLPTRSPVRGGVEHWRNIIPMDSNLNALKSDKLATIKGARQAGVPLTKSSALQMDFGDVPGVDWETQQRIILGDIEGQGSDVKTTRQVRQTLTQNPKAEKQGEKFVFRNGSLRFGSVQPVVPNTPKPQPKSQPKPDTTSTSKSKPRMTFGTGGGVGIDIPGIQREFDPTPGVGSTLGGGRTIEMGDFSLGTV